jgi:ribonucleoside-triphosphate reductase
MRNLEVIEKDLADAREELANVTGKPAEVYSRIVGYYRSVRNWNRGKREEYGERKLYDMIKAGQAVDAIAGEKAPDVGVASISPQVVTRTRAKSAAKAGKRLLLFVRPACPGCPPAKAAAGNLGIPVETVNADTDAGLAEAALRNVYSTPTAILLSGSGEELSRARDSASIASMGSLLEAGAA